MRFKGVLSRTLAAALRRMRTGPLPEVREVDWSEWEQSVAAWEDSVTKPAEAPVPGGKRREHTIADNAPDVSETDWATWEESVRAIERARQRSGRE